MILLIFIFSNYRLGIINLVWFLMRRVYETFCVTKRTDHRVAVLPTCNADEDIRCMQDSGQANRLCVKALSHFELTLSPFLWTFTLCAIHGYSIAAKHGNYERRR